MGWQAVLGALTGALAVAFAVALSLQRRTKRQALSESLALELRENREAMRRLAVEFVSREEAAVKEDIRNQMTLRLNPNDDVDNKLVELMNQIILTPENEELKTRFIYAVQCMLKYDLEQTREQAGWNHKHGKLKHIAKEIAKVIVDSKEVENLRLRLGANRELPQAPREFAAPEKKEEEVVLK